MRIINEKKQIDSVRNNFYRKIFYFDINDVAWLKILKEFEWNYFLTLSFPPELIEKNGYKFVNTALLKYLEKLDNKNVSCYWVFEVNHSLNSPRFYMLVSDCEKDYLIDSWFYSLGLDAIKNCSANYCNIELVNKTSLDIDNLLFYMNKPLWFNYIEFFKNVFGLYAISGVYGRTMSKIFYGSLVVKFSDLFDEQSNQISETDFIQKITLNQRKFSISSVKELFHLKMKQFYIFFAYIITTYIIQFFILFIFCCFLICYYK